MVRKYLDLKGLPLSILRVRSRVCRMPIAFDPRMEFVRAL
jgi:hypothetical protein